MIAEEEISMGMVVMDIKGVIEATTGEAKEVTIGRGISTGIIIREATSVVIT